MRIALDFNELSQMYDNLFSFRTANMQLFGAHGKWEKSVITNKMITERCTKLVCNYSGGVKTGINAEDVSQCPVNTIPCPLCCP